jgi:hypothetical protein
MIVPINIDLSDLVEEFDLSQDQSTFLGSSIIDVVITEYQLRWENLINRELRTTRNEYKRGVFIERESPLSVTFGLTNRSSIPLMIEEGQPPFDEKEGFRNSPKRKEAEGGGWYIDIPFRHATSEAVADSGLFSTIMPQQIYDAVRKTGRLGIGNLQGRFAEKGERKEINRLGVNKPSYMHKAPIYQGLTKVNIASTANETRSGYFTWRRVSDASDPNSWWNGGIIPYKLMDKALEQAKIDVVADRVINEFLKAI